MTDTKPYHPYCGGNHDLGDPCPRFTRENFGVPTSSLDVTERAAFPGVGAAPPDGGALGLMRTRLPLPGLDGDLVIVGDTLEPGGRIMSLGVSRTESAAWTWLDWSDLYGRLAARWRAKYGDGPTRRRHTYLSTGCLHGQHDYCAASTGHAGAKTPATCKFCAASCICWCHATTAGPVDAHHADPLDTVALTARVPAAELPPGHRPATLADMRRAWPEHDDDTLTAAVRAVIDAGGTLTVGPADPDNED